MGGPRMLAAGFGSGVPGAERGLWNPGVLASCRCHCLNLSSVPLYEKLGDSTPSVTCLHRLI